MFRTSSLRLVLNGAAEILGAATMRKVWLLTFARVAVGLLDLAGVFLLSLFSFVAIHDGSSTNSRLLYFSPLETSPLLLLGAALVTLSVKSLLSYYLNIKLTATLNARCSEVIKERSKALADTDKEKLDVFTTQQLHYMLTAGLRAGTTGVLNPLSTLMSEGSLLVLFAVFLLMTNTVAAVLTVISLGISSRQLHRFLSRRQYRNGQLTGSAAIKSVAGFQEGMHGYRELFVRGTLSTVLERFGNTEFEISRLQTAQTALGTLPRHVLETVVMLSLGLIAATSILIDDIQSAVLLLTVFGAATARILPSLIPLQASLAEIQVNLGKAIDLDAVLKFGGKSKRQIEIDDFNFEHVITPSLCFLDVSYKYPRAKGSALEEVKFDFVGPGWCAIDGPSGSGKSTIFDLLMGIRTPSSGEVQINGQDPWSFIKANPGYCAYLPQRVSVANSSIAENIAFGTPLDQIDLARVKELIDAVGLQVLSQRSDQGLLEPIGELGSSLSGGQLQRLGIARCLYSNPSILLLDESTTGLDELTQASVLNLLEKIKTTVLIVSISHDEKITRRADQVVKILEGRINGAGSC
jgi:ABC-type bacteriocin/lantibiotic exporter with double-glycine peptidase domain